MDASDAAGSPWQRSEWSGGSEAQAEHDVARELVRSRLFDEFSPVTLAGRYELGALIGHGGMGVVHRAFDRKLGRDVAIKLLNHRTHIRLRMQCGGGSTGQQRLRDEASMMARLNSPHVVPVFDLGVTDDDRTFLAMELVEGTTLRTWLRARKRSFDEILRTYCGAVDGLAAAHAAGIVHRDFKPDNVMVNDAGLARILDFGLARPHAGPEEQISDTDDAQGSSDTTTRTHAIAGTPAYMAPEQLAGESASQHSDQFAFCVALYEAICGVRPFEAGTLEERQKKVTLGPSFRGAGANVPRWLRPILRRGLAEAPTARFPSVAALRAALEPPRRIGWPLAGGIIALAGVGLWVAAPPDSRSCPTPESKLAGVWDVEVQAQLEPVVASGKDLYRQGWDRVRAALDAYRDDWAAEYAMRCDHTVRTDPLYDARMRCLETRLRELAAFTEVLRGVQDESIRTAIHAAQSLTSIAACRDDDHVASIELTPFGEVHDGEMQRALEVVARAEALADVQDFAPVVTLAEVARAAAIKLDSVALHARAKGLKCDAEHGLGRLEDATESCEHAFFYATKHRQTEVAFLAATKLVTVRNSAGDPQEALVWARHARAQLGDGSVRPTDAAWIDFQEARVFEDLGRLEDAHANFDRVRAVFEREFTPPHHAIADVYNSIGAVLNTMGRFEEAIVAFDKTLAMDRAVTSDTDPSLSIPLGNKGRALQGLGRLDEALQIQRQALAMAQSTTGREYECANTLNSIGVIHQLKGEPTKALEAYQRSLALLRTVVGEAHPRYAGGLANAAMIRAKLGAHDEALADLRRAVRLSEANQGVDSVATDMIRAMLAHGLLQADHTEEGIGMLEAALAKLAPKLGGEHPMVLEIRGILEGTAAAE